MKPRFFPYLFCLLLSPFPLCLSQVSGSSVELRAPAEDSNRKFGNVVAGLEDLDGDGFGDVAVGYGSDHYGYVEVFNGSDGSHRYTLSHPPGFLGNTHLFGRSIAGIGDINGDGLSEIIVGSRAVHDEMFSYSNSGRAFIFDGTTGTFLRKLVSPNEERDSQFGVDVARVPDANGDGISEIVVGARLEDVDGVLDRGRAYIFDGSTGAALHTLTHANMVAFGRRVSGVPDVNGDGRGDVVVSGLVPGATLESTTARAAVFDGSSGALLHTIEIVGPAVRSFSDATGISDITGDGLGDVLLCDGDAEFLYSRNGRVYLIDGASGNLVQILTEPLQNVKRAYGTSVAGVPDLNSDGYGEILVGREGRAYLYDGGTRRLLRSYVSPGEGGGFGLSVSGVPNTTVNGISAFIVGAPKEDPGASPSDAGRAYILQYEAPRIEGGVSLDFGVWDITWGPTDATPTTIINSGSGELFLSCPQGLQIIGLDAADFRVESDPWECGSDCPCDTPIPGNSQGDIFVSFDPSSPGVKSATLQVFTNDFDTPTLSIPLTGTAIWLLPNIEVAPNAVDFGELDILVGPSPGLSIAVGNSGDIDLHPSCAGGLEIIGPDAEEFEITNSLWECLTCPCPTGLSPGSEGQIDVVFDPSSVGTKSATLEIRTNDAHHPLVEVALAGLATLNKRPTQPSVSILPSNPTTTNDLVCLATGSIDPEGEAVSYSYQWLKNGSEIPGATQPTVDSSQTAKGDLFRCVASPRDDEFFGPPGEASVTIRNSTPTQPVVRILPENPTPDQGLAVRIDTESTDADQDLIVYLIEWYESENGVVWVRRTEISGNRIPYDQGSASVPDLLTQAADFWRVEVTPIEAHTVINVKSPDGLKGLAAPVEGTAGVFEVFILPDLNGDDVANANDLLILVRNWHKTKSELEQSEREMFFDSIDPPDAQVGVRHLLRTFVSSWDQVGASK